MRVLHINASVTKGGAAVAAYRLHTGLLAEGHESRIVAGDAVPGRDDVQTWTARNGRWFLARQASSWLEIRLGLDGLLNVDSRFGYRRQARWADVINLHNLHGHHFSLCLLPKLERYAPLVWTLHDMWPLTGHCACPMECEGWLTGCGRCGNLAGPPALERDTTRMLYRAKRRVYAKVNPVLVTPSRWLLDNVRRSPLTQRFRCLCIPHGLDLSVFRSTDRMQARAALGLGREDRLIMCGAASPAARHKGMDLLSGALDRLRATGLANVRIVYVGNTGAPLSELSGLPVRDYGNVGSPMFMAMLYSAADVFVLPTRADNLPNMLIESIACGTPCVSFRVGGVPDIVRPGLTGWLAEPEDAGDLARCLHTALADDRARQAMASTCRSIAEKEYDIRVMVRRYANLYAELAAERSGRGPGRRGRA